MRPLPHLPQQMNFGAAVRILHRDIETRSTIDLTDVGAWRYAGDPTTGVWCVAYAVDDGPAQIWIPGQPIPEEFHVAARDPDWIVVAHNDAFERAIEERILAPRYSWPIVPIERHRCTMAIASASALPAALGTVAEVLQLSARKDDDGARLMKQMARPRKPRAGEDPAGIYWHDDHEKLEALHAYCRQDVEVERELFHRLPPLADSEQALWVLDQLINQRGFHTDGPLLKAASRIAAAAGQVVQEEIARITNGELNSTDQVAALQAWLGDHGCDVKDVRKGTLIHALRRNDLDPIARQVVELRLGAAHAAAAKIDTLLAWQDTDHRVRGTLRFHGAGTGRWTGHGPQPQNFKRDGEGIEAKRIAIATGDLAHVQKLYQQPLEAVGDIARAMICAAPGHQLLIGDFSGVESRVLAWVSGQQSKLDQWAKFDHTGDPEDEPYYLLGRSCGRPEESARSIGKTADLAFGYMGGPGAWDRLSPDDDTSSEDDKRRYQKTWRRLHPQTVKFWGSINRAAINAVRKPGTTFSCRRLTVVYDGEIFVRIILPSGRALSYPSPRLATDKFGNTIVVFKDCAAGKWVDCRFGQGAYGGLWAENIVQAVARDLLAAAMQRLEAAGYPIVLHVHDEIVAEAPIEFGSIEEFRRLITTLPDWAEGLPTAAKVRNGPRFSKSEKPATKPSSHDVKSAPSDELVEIPPMITPPVPQIDQSEGDDSSDEFIPPWEDEAAPNNRNRVPATTDSKPKSEESDSVDDIIIVDMPWIDINAIKAQFRESGDKASVEDNSGAPSAGNGRDQSQQSDERKQHQGNYSDRSSEKHADKPYQPIRAALLAKGYQVARTFAYTLPDGKELYSEDRYELRSGITPTKQRPRKTSRYWHYNDKHKINGTGPRRIIYNWPAIMAAGPGVTVFITEGANKSEPLNQTELLATAAPYHQWGPECIAALASRHLIYLEDHDLADEDGRIKAKEFSSDAHRNLGPVAASFRIVPALHLWKNLGRNDEPPHGWDVKDWLEAGGDATKLLDICHEILTDGARLIYIDMSRWDFETAPEQEWAVYNRIPLRQCALFSGEGATGKSTEQLHLCAATVLKDDWLGAIPEQGPAIFIDAEDDEKVLHRRLKAIAAHYDTSIATMIERGLRLVSWLGWDATLATASRNGKIEPTPLYKQLLEEAGDIKPRMIGIASSANVFAGSENDRAQVQQFVSLLTRIAMVANGSLVLISHPSLTGINTESGLSGTTQWHNAMRARYYLRSVKPEPGEPLDTDLREIVFKKNNYGTDLGKHHTALEQRLIFARRRHHGRPSGQGSCRARGLPQTATALQYHQPQCQR
jgi:DNA polymerase bacteriophage-type